MNASTRAILSALADCVPEDEVRVEASGDRDRLWLPKPPGADYALYIETHLEGGGLLIGALPDGAPERALFWYLPLEYPPDAEQRAVGALVEEARRLIMSRSRIIQTAGFLLWRFRCEVEERGEWKRVGGTMAYLRPFFLPPFPFQLKRWEYASGPLRPRI